MSHRQLAEIEPGCRHYARDCAELAREALPERGPVASDGWWLERQGTGANKKQSLWLVARLGEEIIATIATVPLPEAQSQAVWYIDAIATREEYRRRSVGRVLLESVLENAISAGVDCVVGESPQEVAPYFLDQRFALTMADLTLRTPSIDEPVQLIRRFGGVWIWRPLRNNGLIAPILG